MSNIRFSQDFMAKQSYTVRSFLNWERWQYPNARNTDPVDRDYISTQNQDIFYVRPRGWGKGRGRGKTPVFFMCPFCSGRAFWGTPVCIWCNEDILQGVEMDDTTSYQHLNEYLYPTTDRPGITAILAKFDDEEKLDPKEIDRELKNIEERVPITSYYSEEIMFGKQDNQWSLFLQGEPVTLQSLGVKVTSDHAILYRAESDSKYFLSKALASKSGHNCKVVKANLRKLTILPDFTLVPKRFAI